MLFDALNAVSCPASIAVEALLVHGTEMRQTARDRPLYFACLAESQRFPRTASVSRSLVNWSLKELNRAREIAPCNSLTAETTMAKMKKLEDLFHNTLKDVYFAEKKILASLPKMAKAAQHAGLKAAFEKHLGETEGQIDRLEQVFAEIDKKPQSKTCDAIVGIAKEGQEIMDEYKGMPAHDAGLLAAAQAVEHYEMTRYGTLRTWAEELGYVKSAKLLQQTLDEERATDAALTKLAKAVINLDAEKDEAA